MLKRELNFPETLEPENKAPTVYARKVKQKAKLHAQDQLKQKKWEDKPMYGQYPKMTIKWPTNGLRKLGLSLGLTDGFVIATQDQAINTNY